jgi:hypothetical protein
MQRYKQLFKETWWLWLIFTAIVASLCFFVSLIFLMTVPILVTVFFYFAFVRYDKDGNFLGS